MTEEALRAMSPAELHDLTTKEGINLPDGLSGTDEIVDWLLANLD